MKKARNQRLFLMMLLCLCLSIFFAVPAEAKKKPTSVKLNKTVYTLKKGKSVKLKATVLPKKAGKKKIVWKSSKKKIATVSSKGKVKAKKKGTATITATVKGTKLKAKCKIIVGTPVKKVALNKSNISLYEGEKTSVKAAVSPKKATTKKVKYTSSNSAVAAVNASGQITAKKAGTAKITATATDGTGKKASVNVTVKKKAATPDKKTEDKKTTEQETVKEATVSSQSELTKALENSKLETLTVGTGTTNLTIPAGDYTGISLIVNAPNGHIENSANFKVIRIKAISNSTFVEKASGNTIIYEAQTGTVQIADGAVASVEVASGAGQLNLINDGNISLLKVETPASIDLSGTTDQQSVAVEATSGAENASITTNQNLNITANAKLNLTLKSGAEETVETVQKASQVPSVTGLGSVPVTITETGQLETVVGKNTGDSTETQKVKVNGAVQDSKGDGIDGASVCIIPYDSAITASNIGTYAEKAAAKCSTGSDGSYASAEITIGNYYLYVTKDGYQPVMETLTLTSTSNAVYHAGTVKMISSESTEPGSLSGTLKDAESGEPVVSGITVLIRSGRNNVSGEALAETKTDENGQYSFIGLTPGQYTVQAVDNRGDEAGKYIAASFNAIVDSGENTQDGTITYEIAGGQVRFVLTWGDEASGASSDLDSHLVGPAASGGQFHTWYSDKVYSESTDTETIRYADLDVDDTDYVGPETTTIYQKTSGTYHFYIHDYSNGSNPTSTQMSKSSAVVKVYIGETLKRTFNMPNQAGNLWYVCDYDADTNKITEVNTVSGWSDDEENIGVDLYEKYHALLKKYIDRVTEVKALITDQESLTEVNTMLETAQNVYDTSKDKDELKEQCDILKEWLSDISDGLRISDVSGTGIYDYGYDSDKILGGSTVLNIYSYAKNLPSDLSIEVADGSSYKLDSSDNSDYEKMIVVTSSKGLSCKYYINYSYNPEYFCKIDTVTATNESGESVINDWDWSTVYDDDDENILYYKLYVYALKKEIPDNFKVTAYSEDAEVKYETSDKDGYAKKITISYDGASRVYYLEWKYDADYLCRIDTVTATNESGESVIDDWDWSTVYDDDDENILYYKLYVYALKKEIPDNFKVTAYSEDAEVKYETSDKDGYAKKITISYDGASRVYYLEWKYDADYLCRIDTVTATNESGESVIDNWDYSSVWDDDDETLLYYNLYVNALQKEIPDSFKVTAYDEDAEVKYETSDKDGYAEKITISCDGASRVYYLEWSYYSEEYACGIHTMTATNESGKSVIEDWVDIDVWDDNDDTILYYKLCVDASQKNVPDNFKVTASNYDADIKYETSDIEGYDKKITISYDGFSRVYYLEWNYNADYLCRIDTVTATNESGESVIDNWDYDSVWYDGEDEETILYYDLYVDALQEEIPDNFKVTAYSEDAEVKYETSDKDGYTKKITISCDGASRVYYLKWNYESSAAEDDSTGETAEEENNTASEAPAEEETTASEDPAEDQTTSSEKENAESSEEEPTESTEAPAETSTEGTTETEEASEALPEEGTTAE